MLCVFLPEETMDVVRGYRLESLSRLKCISITEILFGLIGLLLFIVAIVLALTHRSTQDNHLTWSWSLFLIVGFYFLLFIAGCFGVHVVRRCRKGVASSSSFTALAGMNVILCIIYSILLVLIIISAILVGVLAHYMHAILNHIAQLLNLHKDTIYDPAQPAPGHTAQETVHKVTSAVTIVMVVIFSVIGTFLLLFTILTGCAAKISRRNAAILKTPTSGNYNDSLLASMGGTYPKQVSTYGEYQPIRQQI
ncbi:uncharacterized protein LOC129584011 [Paramacrobiotus metropolitanus]|uniref:uncharacterized protein LOC129584011 n=1 Tax=Paramacrobiotus metropolitanus TaxID=2943436 RepID=UPI0024462921|nr:uncharacterized protein LOC129584011 [Paramacrobiotus metropolitanus]